MQNTLLLKLHQNTRRDTNETRKSPFPQIETAKNPILLNRKPLKKRKIEEKN